MARQRCDALAGTAAPATGWLLVEDNGPWARRAFEDSPLDPQAGRAIVDRARTMNVRPLFIRKHGRRTRRHDAHRFAFVDATTRRTAWGRYDRLADLVDADWSADAGTEEPLYLVCTHGRHDQCCAIAGRPMAVTMSALRRRQTWECSHVGGDRFAANVVVLPWGLYYGFTGPADAHEIVTASEQGQLVPRLLRGMTTDPALIQAARVAAQQAVGTFGIDDLQFMERRLEQRGRWRVNFRTRKGEAVTVTVEQHRIPDLRPTCRHKAPVPMRELSAIAVVVEPAH